MILLDTNVISAVMRLPDEPRVRKWLDTQDCTRLFISAPSIFELSHGIERLPPGRRRLALESVFVMVLGKFSERILDFGMEAAIEAGKVRALHTARGRNAEVVDHQIAGIAIARKAAIATRNTTDFAGLGVKTIGPWQ